MATATVLLSLFKMAMATVLLNLRMATARVLLNLLKMATATVLLIATYDDGNGNGT